MPLDLAIGRFNVADDDLYGLAGQSVELLWQHQQLVGFDLPLVAHVDEVDVDGIENPVLSPPLWNWQDLHPGAGQSLHKDRTSFMIS